MNRVALCTFLCMFFLAAATAVVRAGDVFPEFVENKGQWNSAVTFRAELAGGVFWAEQNGFVFTVMGEGWSTLGHDDIGGEVDESLYGMHHYRVRFEGASIPAVAGEKPRDHHYNYYVGNDPAHWAQGVKPYERFRYTEVYPNTDLLVYGKGDRLKYDFKVHPGGEPETIRMNYEGADSLAIVNGNLIVYTSVREVVELEPYAYQLINGNVQTVACDFKISGQSVQFIVGDYDPSHTLVIDPEIAFSTLIGSVASNFGFTACDDPDGNLIAGACVFAAGYPTTMGAIQTEFSQVVNANCDAAISKFSADGTQLMYSTYLGGNGLEMPHSVIADNEGNYIVMGTTGSTNFPVTAEAFQPTLAGGPVFSFANFFIQASHTNGCDFFISRFSADDSGLLSSTYIGGNDTDGMNMADKLFYNYGDSFRGEVITDVDNNIIVASTTNSADFPMAGNGPQTTLSGGQDGIVFKMNPELTELLWSTYIGGPDADAAYSVQTDSNGALVVAGGTKSTNLFMPPGAFQATHAGDVDAFVYRFSDNGQTIDAGTFLGSGGYDQAFFVQLDLEDQIYIFGQSDGDLEIAGDVYNNPNSGQFVTKFNHALTARMWQTTIGTGSGAIDISPTAFLVSDCDQIYLSGWGGMTNVMSSPYALQSTTSGLPLTDDAFQSTTDGSDFYLCVLDPDATQLAFATFFGGPQSREHVDGGTSTFDKDGSVYQAVCAGCGANSDYPTTPGAWSSDNPSNNCNLGVFKFDLAKIEAGIAIEGPMEVCQFADAVFINETIGANIYLWDFGDGTTSTQENPVHVYTEPGSYEVTLVASHTNDCMAPDMAVIWLEVLPGVNPSVDDVPIICEGESVQLNANGSADVFWLDDPTLSAINIPNPIATPVEPVSTYFLVDSNDCGSDTTEVVVLWDDPDIQFPEDQLICLGQSASLSVTGGVSHTWSPSTGLNATNVSTVIAAPETTTTYTITVTSAIGCTYQESVTLTVEQNPPGGERYPDVGACFGEPVMISANGGTGWAWQPAELCNDPFSQTPIVTISEDTDFTVEVTNACGIGIDSVLVRVIIPEAFAGNDGAVCRGQSHPVWAAGGESYFWSPPAFVANPTSAETAVNPNASTTFTAYVTDEYGCTAEAQVNVTVLDLPYVNAGPDRILEWLESDYLFGNSDGVEWWWEPDLYIDCADCLTAITTPEESLWYTLYTIDANGCRNADSVFVDVYFPVYVPNTFTPNNDGVNDIFKAYGTNVRGFRMEVRNRWGELIFVSEDINHGWDGSVNNGEHYVQIDTYIWTVYYEGKERRQKMTGHVNVIR